MLHLCIEIRLDRFHLKRTQNQRSTELNNTELQDSVCPSFFPRCC